MGYLLCACVYVWANMCGRLKDHILSCTTTQEGGLEAGGKHPVRIGMKTSPGVDILCVCVCVCVCVGVWV